MRRKCFMGLAAAVLTAVLLSACWEDSPEIADIKTIEPPEDGWTHEQLSEVTYLCGEPFSLPCKLEELPESIEIEKVVHWDKDKDDAYTYITVDGQDTDYYDAWLLWGGENIGLAKYYENGTDKIVFGVDINIDLHGREVLVINGINQNSSFLKIRQALGETFTQDEDISWIYRYKVANSEYPEEYIILISFDENDETAAIGHTLFDIKTVK